MIKLRKVSLPSKNKLRNLEFGISSTNFKPYTWNNNFRTVIDNIRLDLGIVIVRPDLYITNQNIYLSFTLLYFLLF
jgi:hypothetical protein